MEQSRIRVKFLSKAQSADRDYERWLCRFPEYKPFWGKCEFIFDQDAKEYDWLVVYDDLPRKPGDRKPLWEEKLSCPRSRTLLITTEPSSIKLYGNSFLSQFGWVLSSQEPSVIKHPRTIFRQAGLVWFYGMPGERASWDHMNRAETPEKTSLISTLCSSKQMAHTLHQSRYDFTQALKKRLPSLEIYGQGVRPIDNKADALDPFRYHIAIENHVCDHHWTEKLCDPFLGYSLPFYHGCSNAADYFPEDSFIPIDIHCFGKTLEHIERAIRDDEWTKRLPAIREARRLVLEKYGTFQQLASLIEERHPSTDDAVEGSILSRHLMRRRRPLDAIREGASKLVLQTRNRLSFQKFSEDS